jgi:hypothetical protein
MTRMHNPPHPGEVLADTVLRKDRGSRYWRFKFRINKLEKVLALRVYPDVTLKLALKRRDEARRQVAQDSIAKRRAEKSTPSNRFEAVGREWFAAYSPPWAPAHAGKVRRRLEMDIYPWIGRSPFAVVPARATQMLAPHRGTRSPRYRA